MGVLTGGSNKIQAAYRGGEIWLPPTTRVWPKKNTITELNRIEVDLVNNVGKTRNQSNIGGGVRSSKINDLPDEAINIQGFGAELASCKLFNAYPDLTIFTRSAIRGEDFFDLIIDNLTFDVKANFLSDGHLLVASWKSEGKHPDYYILMTGRMPVYTYRGMMSSKTLYNLPKRDLGHGLTYLACQYQLIEVPGMED